MANQTCYMCDAPSTSVDHAPPRCLFPENKDLLIEDKSLNFRDQLITVPACHEHNGKKSMDDEYLFCLLAMALLSGKYGQLQSTTKVLRILKRKPALLAKVLEKVSPAYIKDLQTGKISETIALEIEHDRINSSLESCARALFFNDFNHRFEGNIRVTPLFLSDIDPKFNASVARLSSATDMLFKNIELKGNNPSIFTYRFRSDEYPNKIVLEMTFYEGARATAIFGV